MRSVSVVVPVFNEAESILRLYEEMAQTAAGAGRCRGVRGRR